MATRSSPFTRRRVSIQRVVPEVAGGRYPAIGTVHRPLEVGADLLCDSHDLLAATAKVRHESTGTWTSYPLEHVGGDRWLVSLVPDQLGVLQFTVEAWVDHLGTWRRDTEIKADAGTLEEIDLAVGAKLFERLVRRARGDERRELHEVLDQLNDANARLEARITAALDPALGPLLRRLDPRADKVTSGAARRIRIHRERAACSAWYELFPRSASTTPETHGTLRDVIDRLDYIAGLGFDVVYLPPIHPIGHTNRKGRNNALHATADDPGSPWAIGSHEGGHRSIHPELGTLEDFHALVAACQERGMELALDIAFQCAPDHPWVEEHPEWFRRRPDGSIQYAENPPKKYQDIYPFDFETSDPEGLWRALKGVFDYWIEQGVKIFRVDNPHTKSLPFWEWCLAELMAEHPDTIFLSEAFTRPKLMYELAMKGFTQSYTYFAWRQHKAEIEAYYTELFQTEVADFFRPNSWPNTPDILTEQLQHGGRATYVQRLVLAATLTANYGMYGPAFELMWSQARDGVEEYLDNEKYEIKRWDVDQPQSLAEVITLVNRIRRAHPALQQDRTLRFHHIDNDQLLVYSKTDPAGTDTVLVAVNLDPTWTQAGFTWLDLEVLGIDTDAPFVVDDLFGGGTYTWQGPRNYIELDPHITPAHIFHLRRLPTDTAHSTPPATA